MNAAKQKERFNELVRAHGDKLYRICYGYCTQREDVQDVYQEILIKIWKYLPTFKGDAKITTWLFRIAVNTCLTFVGSEQKRKAQVAPLQAALVHATSVSNEIEQQKGEQLQHLQWCISQLASMDKSLILLTLEGLSYKEITDITGLTNSNVGVRLNRAKAKLQKMMQDEF